MNKSYKFPTEILPYLSLDDQLDDLKRMIIILKELKIDVSNTRIDRYYKFFDAIKNKKNIEPSTFFPNSQNSRFQSNDDWILYINREVHELLWIIKGLKVTKPKGIHDKLKIIVCGADFAALDTNDTSRNLQYELRIASYFCQIGWYVDLSTLTDIVVHTPEFNLFIECKKITNIKKLSKRLNEAKKQINSRMPKKYLSKPCYSFLCADVTQVAFPHNGLVWGITPEHTKDIIQEKIIEISQNINSTQYFMKTKKLLNIWLQIHIPALVRTPPMHTTRFSSYEIINGELHGKPKRALEQIIKNKESVINDTGLVPSKKIEQANQFTIPAGSTFQYKDNVLNDFLSNTLNFDPNSDEVLLSLKIKDQELNFYPIDFYMIQDKLSASDRKMLLENKEMAMFKVMGLIIAYRFPFGLEDIF